MILANIAGLARPARMAENSSRVASTDLSILPSASWRMSLITVGPFGDGARRGRELLAHGGQASGGGDERSDLLTLYDAQHVALGGEPEGDQVHLALLGQGERRLVDYPQVAGDRLVLGQVVVLRGVRVELGVSGVDAVDAVLGE